MAEERISKLEDISTETTQTELQRKKKNEILKEATIISEGVTCNWKTRRKREEGTKKYVNL